MKQNIFVSVGMRGRTNEEVELDLKRAKDEIRKQFGDDVEIIDNWNCQGPDDAGRLWYLGEAVKKLDDCDICYFVKGWQNHKGCVAEYEICKIYGIEIIEES